MISLCVSLDYHSPWDGATLCEGRIPHFTKAGVWPVLSRRFCGALVLGTIGVAMLAQLPQTKPIVPPPTSYQLVEYAWLKEDGRPPEDWKQYNNTGWNRLNLTYRFSKCNMAYVARTDAAAGNFTVTFIAYYNSSASSGFDDAGYLFAGSQPNWSITVPAEYRQTSGAYSYHLFVTTFDPQGIPGIYQVRINETGPGSGSSWASPAGNPNVQWMFFQVPTSEPLVRILDQMKRASPFFLDGASPSTLLNATMTISPPGNQTGASSATVDWTGPAGNTIMSHTAPIRYVPGVGWTTTDIVAANTSAFPFNATDDYRVKVTMGYFVGYGKFRILSTQWIAVELGVRPIYGQWFDPSSLQVSFAAVLNTGLPGNPYQDAYNLTLQLWYGNTFRGWIGNISWNITGYPVVPGSSYTYTYTKMIPASLIDPSGNGSVEFFGNYWIKARPTVGLFPATVTQRSFYVDDPIEAYPSLEKASSHGRSTFKAGDTIWVNVELDPTYLRSRMNANQPFSNPSCTFTWEWPNPPPDFLKQESVQATQNRSWPSNQYWAFSTISTNISFPDGVYLCRISAKCDSGYTVWELRYYETIESYTPPTESPNVPPYTTIKPKSSQDWHTIPTQIEFHAADPLVPGWNASGVKVTFYQIDNGPLRNDTGRVFSFTAPEGSHVYTFWSEDYAGNAEMPQTAIIKVDTRPPVTAISPEPSGDPYPPPLTVYLLAQDPEPGSGIYKTYYAIDSQDPLEYRPDGFLALEGDHVYTYWSLDTAGNCELKKQALIKVGIPEASLPMFAGSIALLQLLSLVRQRFALGP